MKIIETVAICEKCWNERELGRAAVRLRNPDKEHCYYCGEETTSGIYVRTEKVGAPP